MKNQIKTDSNTLQSSIDLQKTQVSKKAWAEPQIEDLDINAGLAPSSGEIGFYYTGSGT